MLTESDSIQEVSGGKEKITRTDRPINPRCQCKFGILLMIPGLTNDGSCSQHLIAPWIFFLSTDNTKQKTYTEVLIRLQLKENQLNLKFTVV